MRPVTPGWRSIPIVSRSVVIFARNSSPDAVRRLGGPGNMLTADEMESFWRNYLRDERDAADPRACPILADLRRLPPARLVVAECDLLAEQSVALYRRLIAADVSSRLAIYRGASHSFLEAVSIAPLADRALHESAEWLREVLAARARCSGANRAATRRATDLRGRRG